MPDRRSYWGGCPLWPVDMEWPHGLDGDPAIFLMQVDLVDLPSRPSTFPDRGILYFFSHSGLEDADGYSDEPMVYFASADRRLELRKPPGLIEPDTWNYRASVVSAEKISSHDIIHDLTLPKRGLGFKPYEDYLFPSWDPNKSTSSDNVDPRLIIESKEKERDILEKSAFNLEALSRMLAELSLFSRKKSLPIREKNAGRLPEGVHYGIMDLLDPGAKRRRKNLPSDAWSRKVREDTFIPLHPVYAEWPHRPMTIFHHARLISNTYGASENAVSRNEMYTRLAQQYPQSAEKLLRKQRLLDTANSLRGDLAARLFPDVSKDDKALGAARIGSDKRPSFPAPHLALQVLDEARRWTEWSHARLDETTNDEGVQSEYRDWCHNRYNQLWDKSELAGKSIARWRKQPTWVKRLLPAPRKAFSDAGWYGEIMNRFEQAGDCLLDSLNDTDGDKLVHLSEEELKVALFVENLLGGMFGFGDSFQLEAYENLGRLLLWEVSDGPKFYPQSGPKFWLDDAVLIPDAWQKVFYTNYCT
ncbi:MAG: DUF1963 domain-containing protein [Rhodobacter sp.]|nr:DUF1963 domain-containing protein [Rhodobacter sp.]